MLKIILDLHSSVFIQGHTPNQVKVCPSGVIPTHKSGYVPEPEVGYSTILARPLSRSS